MSFLTCLCICLLFHQIWIRVIQSPNRFINLSLTLFSLSLVQFNCQLLACYVCFSLNRKPKSITTLTLHIVTSPPLHSSISCLTISVRILGYLVTKRVLGHQFPSYNNDPQSQFTYPYSNHVRALVYRESMLQVIVLSNLNNEIKLSHDQEDIKHVFRVCDLLFD